MEDNIIMDLEEVGINDGNWVDSAQDRNYWRAIVSAALNLRFFISYGISQFLGSFLSTWSHVGN